MLEDSGVPYSFEPHDGAFLDSTVVAVPALKVDGEWISQTLAIMHALGEKLNYAKPARGQRPLMTRALHNIADIQVDPRGASKPTSTVLV